MKNPHTELRNRTLLILAETGLGRFWPNETGMAIASKYVQGKWVPDIPYRPIKFGLVGSADISGIIQGGFRFEGECKTGTGKPSKQQLLFKAMIENHQGLYVLIRTPEDAISELKKFLSSRQ